MEDIDKLHCKASLADYETENIALCIYDASFLESYSKGYFPFQPAH